MKKIDVIGGLDRLIEASTEKFNTLCEKEGIDPEDPVLTGEDDGTDGEEGGDDGVSDADNGGETQQAADGNTIPTPDDAAGAALPADAAAQMNAAPAAEPIPQGIPQDAAVGGDAQQAMPPVEGGEPTPEEIEKLKEQQQQ